MVTKAKTRQNCEEGQRQGRIVRRGKEGQRGAKKSDCRDKGQHTQVWPIPEPFLLTEYTPELVPRPSLPTICYHLVVPPPEPAVLAPFPLPPHPCCSDWWLGSGVCRALTSVMYLKASDGSCILRLVMGHVC